MNFCHIQKLYVTFLFHFIRPTFTNRAWENSKICSAPCVCIYMCVYVCADITWEKKEYKTAERAILRSEKLEVTKCADKVFRNKFCISIVTTLSNLIRRSLKTLYFLNYCTFIRARSDIMGIPALENTRANRYNWNLILKWDKMQSTITSFGIYFAMQSIETLSCVCAKKSGTVSQGYFYTRKRLVKSLFIHPNFNTWEETQKQLTSPRCYPQFKDQGPYLNECLN